MYYAGSFIEFLDIIPYLTDPPTGTQAFHVVIPSLPGYTFSSPPLTSTWVMDDTARLFDKLMIGLGYHAYVAQGGDWGSVTARCLGALHSEHCKGELCRKVYRSYRFQYANNVILLVHLAVHLNFVPAFPPGLLGKIPARTLISWLPSWMMSEKDRYSASRGLDYTERGSAYYQIQRFTVR
jgi:pimeloyl-ACP methyl ester carboxylesterase